MTAEPNSAAELDAVFYAMSRGDHASFVPRLRATIDVRDLEIRVLKRALFAACDDAWADGLTAYKNYLERAAVPSEPPQ